MVMRWRHRMVCAEILNGRNIYRFSNTTGIQLYARDQYSSFFFFCFFLFCFLFCWNVLEQVVPWHDDGRLFARQLSKTRNHRTQATFSIVRKTTENRGPTIIIMYYSRDATGPHQSHSAKKIQYVRGSNVKQIVPKSVSLSVLPFPILFLFCVKSFTCDAWLTDRFRYVRAK